MDSRAGYVEVVNNMRHGFMTADEAIPSFYNPSLIQVGLFNKSLFVRNGLLQFLVCIGKNSITLGGNQFTINIFFTSDKRVDLEFDEDLSKVPKEYNELIGQSPFLIAQNMGFTRD
jgi:hypothetical protein